jgi:hypothetical protein
MATSYGSVIPGVTVGLVLYLDAAKRESYPGTGTSWFDLSTSNSTTLLTNGPIHSGFKKDSSFFFDGVDDYATLPSSLEELNGLTEATITIWVKLSSGSNSAGSSGIVQLSGYNNTNGCLYFYTDATRVGGIWLDVFRTDRVFTGDWQPTFDGALWHNLTVTTTPGTDGWKMYLNGILRYSTTGQNVVSVNPSIVGGFRLGQNSGGREMLGDISLCAVYNRSLSAAEVLQNYNATKGRFGL